MTGARRLVALVVVLVLLGGGLAAALVARGSSSGGTSGTTSGTTPSSTPAPTSSAPGSRTPPSPALAAFYHQRLHWTTCHDSDRCTTLRVPMDYAHPGGRTLSLAVVSVPAQDPSARLGDLVVNPGGPGASGVQYALESGNVFGDALLRHFDIVGFDPRGTGASDPIHCLGTGGLDHYLGQDPVPHTAAEITAYVASSRAFGRGCVARSGALAVHVSTVESARDMDVLRAALGESRLTYYGASYGTKLGATYADLFPHRVGRMVLDGAVDPQADPEQLALEQARGFQVALTSYVRNCVTTTPSCFLGSDVATGIRRIEAMLKSTETHPLPASGGRAVGAGDAYLGVITPLYNKRYWVLLSEALQQAFGGDGSLLRTLADAYTERGAKGYTGNLMEAFYDISCVDDPSYLTPAQVERVLPRFERISPIFGAASAWGLVSCVGLHPAHAARDTHLRAAGAPPIVVVGTTRDPATPLKGAIDLARTLASGVLVTRNGDGHTGYHAGNQCVDSAVEDYLVSDRVPRNGLHC